LKITRSISISSNFSWSVSIHDNQILNRAVHPIIADIPSVFTTVADAQNLLNMVDSAMVCPAHPDPDFIESSRNKVFLNQSNEVLAKLDTFATVVLKALTYSKTIRPKHCHYMVAKSGRCMVCIQTRQSMIQRYQ
jgi:hypothetical protein